MSASTISPPPSLATARVTHPFESLLELIRRARSAGSLEALHFVAVNDSHVLAPFQQSALWLPGQGIVALSGLVDIDRNAPYVQWLQGVCRHLSTTPPRLLAAADLPAELAADWAQWLPPHVLWVPFGRTGAHRTPGGWLGGRVLPWREIDLRLFQEWFETWACLHHGLSRPGWWSRIRSAAGRVPRIIRRRPVLCAAGLAVLAACPVRLSVLAPGELVPAQPIAVRAPLDGIIKTFHVQTNERVTAEQPLFSYDETALGSRLEVALEAWRTAEAEQRQLSQQALQDSRARAALAAARGQVEEKRLEVEYLQAQLGRGTVTAPRDGVVFLDNPADWIGRAVTAGERVMRLAEPEDKEIEIWLPVADAIVLPDRAPARLYLNASPLSPASGYLRFVSYEPLRRPDGQYAYRVRAALDQPTVHRVGMKGTARLSGERVPLAYWALRRPFAAAREFIGR